MSFQFLALVLLLLAPLWFEVGTFKVVPEVPKPLLFCLNSCFFILFQLDVYFFLLLQIVDLSPSFLPFTVGSLYILFYFTLGSLHFFLHFVTKLNWASWLPMFWTPHQKGCLSPCHLALFLEFWSVLSFGPYFFVLSHLLHCDGQSLRYLPGWGNPHCCVVVLYVGEGSEKEQCHLLGPLPSFSHFPHYPQANCALLVLIPGWVILCTF